MTMLLKAMRENLRNDPDKAVKYVTAFNSVVTEMGQEGLEKIWESMMLKNRLPPNCIGAILLPLMSGFFRPGVSWSCHDLLGMIRLEIRRVPDTQQSTVAL